MTGDEEFSRFMADRYGALVRTAFLLTADRGHAEDLAQATLIQTFLAWDRLHDAALHAGFGGSCSGNPRARS
jgi:DNA-directed RNA polymerase specialized sigma24 family protein